MNCSAPEFVSTLLLLGVVVFSIVGAMHEHRFITQLKNLRPDIWEEFSIRKLWIEQGDKGYAATQLYIIRGNYNALENPLLIASAERTRRVYLASIALFLPWVFAVVVFQVTPHLSCLYPIFQ